MDLISLLSIIFQLSPFYLGSFCLPSSGAVGGWASGGAVEATSHSTIFDIPMRYMR